MERFMNTYLGLMGLALVLVYVFGRPNDTQAIINGAADLNEDFILSLQGRGRNGGSFVRST